jgi:hypothetical protein
MLTQRLKLFSTVKTRLSYKDKKDINSFNVTLVLVFSYTEHFAHVNFASTAKALRMIQRNQVDQYLILHKKFR